MDPILLHSAATALLAIHSNLALGTIASYLKHRPDLKPLADELVNYTALYVSLFFHHSWKHPLTGTIVDSSGQFCLTEVGHGLDVANLGTTVTLLEDGSFDLHTPEPSASKCV